jgi:hypothetical protein
MRSSFACSAACAVAARAHAALKASCFAGVDMMPLTKMTDMSFNLDSPHLDHALHMGAETLDVTRT